MGRCRSTSGFSSSGSRAHSRSSGPVVCAHGGAGCWRAGVAVSRHPLAQEANKPLKRFPVCTDILGMGATPAIAPAPEVLSEPLAERRETSGVTSRLILSYVERERGREGVDRLLALAGVEGQEQQLRDENHWFSFEKKIALLDAAAEVLDEPQSGRVIGAASLDFNLAQSVKLSLRALGSPALIYKNVAR